MFKRYLLATILFINQLICFSQDNPAEFLKEVFNSIQKADTLRFISHYVSYDEEIKILTGFFTRYGATTIDSQTNVLTTENQYKTILKDSVFPLLTKAISKSNIDLSTASYLDYKYNIVKAPYILFPSLTGTIYFKSMKDVFEIDIKEAIFINDKWKVHQINSVQPISDASVFSQDSARISAFDSFIFKLTDISINDSENNKPEPPPPSPPKSPAYKKVKKTKN